MDSLKCLVEAHAKMTRLEKEAEKERLNLIKEYKNKNGSDCDWYITKIRCSGIAGELKKEMAKFEELLNGLDATEMAINDSIDDFVENEIVDNMDYDSSSTGTHKLYKDSFPVTSSDFQEPEVSEPAMSEQVVFVKIMTGFQRKAESVMFEPVVFVKMNGFKCKELVIKKKKVQKKRVLKHIKVSAGYKYKGTGFEFFAGYKNKGKAVYTSTLLFCQETCRQNAKLLREYLIEYGMFKNEMIENIEFKERYDGSYYALIKARGPLKYIKGKVKALNNTKGPVIRLYERSKMISQRQNVQNVLYVNNFDVVNKETHRRFTKYFLKFGGELVKDIVMGLDKNKDPFAIVHFRHSKDAQKMVDNMYYFGTRALNIKYSKF